MPARSVANTYRMDKIPESTALMNTYSTLEQSGRGRASEGKFFQFGVLANGSHVHQSMTIITHKKRSPCPDDIQKTLNATSTGINGHQAALDALCLRNTER